jgi:hypothetical protein
MRRRLLSFIVGHPGWLRNSVMMSMRLLRKKCQSSQSQPDLRFIRTLQSPHHLVQDESTGRYIISSKAFSPSTADGALSGDLEQILLSDKLHATAMYPAVKNAVGAATVTIKNIQDVGARAEHDPVCTNWYHGSVFGTKSRSVKKKLQQAAIEIIAIDQLEAARLDAAIGAGQSVSS